MDETRVKHSLSVAKRMKELVLEQPIKYEISPDEAFILGLLHDIGYECCTEPKYHAGGGGMLLKGQGYKYWKEVYYHGLPQEVYTSSELRLLNYADMTTNANGDYVSIEERIEDIGARYGGDSVQVVTAMKVAKMLEH